MGLHKRTLKLFKHRESGNKEKAAKAFDKLHDGTTVTEVKPVLKVKDYSLRIAEENRALRTAGGKDLKVDARPAAKRLSKAAKNDDGN